MRFMKVFLLVLTIISAIIILPMLINPLRRPTSMVKNYLLRITPIGMSIDDVISIIENKDEWEISWIDLESGFSPSEYVLSLNRGIKMPNPHAALIARGFVEGQRVDAHIGIYRTITIFYWPYFPLNKFTADLGVHAFWSFDKDGYLTNVYVVKGF